MGQVKRPAPLQKPHPRDSGPQWKRITAWLRAGAKKWSDRRALIVAASERFGLSRHYIECVAAKAIPSEMQNFDHLYTRKTRGLEGLRALFDRTARMDEIIGEELKHLDRGNKWMLDEHMKLKCHGDSVQWKEARVRWASHIFEVKTSRGSKKAWASTKQIAQQARKLMEELA
jgi:hypothetical protein